MSSPFTNAAIIAAAQALGIDISSVGQQEVELLKQLLAVTTALVESGGGGGLGPVTLTGVPVAGQEIVATSPTAAVWKNPTPQVPTWMYDGADNSAPDAGCFTTNNADSSAFTALKLSDFTKPGSNVSSYTLFLNSTWLTLTNITTGKSFSFEIVTATHDAGGFTIYTVNGTGSNTGIISGEYALSFWQIYPNTIQQVLLQSSITPCPDGTVSPVTSITTQNGIITAIS